jgi:hypothetical protein
MLFNINVLNLFISGKSDEGCARSDISVEHWDCGGGCTLPFGLNCC